MWKFLGYAFLFAILTAATAPTQAQLTGSNWTAAFYNNTTLSGDSAAAEVYPHGIYFNWGEGTPYNADGTMPVSGVNADHFSVRFTSTQTFAQGGTYVFTVYVDDGIRVFFDDLPVLDHFSENPASDYRTLTFDHTIADGASIDMRVEYAEFTGSAQITFQWGRRNAPPPIYINTPYDGETVSGDFAPVFSWQAVDTPSYVFRLWSDGGTLLLKVVSPASEICAADVCNLDSGALARRAGIRLKNDEYAWQVKTKGTTEKTKSGIIEFRIEYPGKPLNLTPDFGTVVTDSTPLFMWSEITAANQYKVVLTRLNNSAKIKSGWLPDSAFNCGGGLCTLDPSAMQPPLIIPRGKYKWRVFARDMALKARVSKSAPATFKFTPETRAVPLPAPDAADGFRAP